jgi:hypothetical protein
LFTRSRTEAITASFSTFESTVSISECDEQLRAYYKQEFDLMEDSDWDNYLKTKYKEHKENWTKEDELNEQG